MYYNKKNIVILLYLIKKMYKLFKNCIILKNIFRSLGPTTMYGLWASEGLNPGLVIHLK